jgi:hypothetical protein
MSKIGRLLGLIALPMLGGCVTTSQMSPMDSSAIIRPTEQTLRPPLQVPGIETPRGRFPAVIIGYSDPDEFGQVTYLFYDWRVGDADQYPKRLAWAACDSEQDLPSGNVADILEVNISGFEGQSPVYKMICEGREYRTEG